MDCCPFIFIFQFQKSNSVMKSVTDNWYWVINPISAYLVFVLEVPLGALLLSVDQSLHVGDVKVVDWLPVVRHWVSHERLLPCRCRRLGQERLLLSQLQLCEEKWRIIRNSEFGKQNKWITLANVTSSAMEGNTWREKQCHPKLAVFTIMIVFMVHTAQGETKMFPIDAHEQQIL